MGFGVDMRARLGYNVVGTRRSGEWVQPLSNGVIYIHTKWCHPKNGDCGWNGSKHPRVPMLKWFLSDVYNEDDAMYLCSEISR